MAQQDQENQSQHRRRAMTNGFDSSSVNCKIQGRREMAGLRRLAQLKPIAEEALAGTVFVAKFLCGLHVANTYICTAALTYGPSMLPTLNLTGDFILAERLSTRFGRVGVGDIVLVRSPQNPRKVMAKRLMGMEGDSVTYVVDPKNSDWSETVVVPKGHVWIEGDNIYDSNDSRNFGAVPYGLLQGKIFWRIWPPERFGPLEKRKSNEAVL